MSDSDVPIETGAVPPRQPVVLQVVPSLVTGGVERGTVEIAQSLVAAGWTAIVASSGGPMVREITRAGALHVTLPLASKNPFVIRANIRRLEKVIKEHGVDIVHARSRAPAWSAHVAAQRTGAHFVTTFHGTYSQGMFGLKRLYNSVMLKGERVIAISEFIADHIAQYYGLGPDVVRIVHRGVDLSRFDPHKVSPERIIALAQKWRLPDGYRVITLPGRLTRWKGQAVLIQALSVLDRHDVRCLLVGSDQGRTGYRSELAHMIRRLKLDDVVHIVDECNDMPAAYMLTDIVVSASTDPEAFGRVVVEAQAMGRPVIATGHGAPRETVVQGRTGWLVPPNDPRGLAEALDRFLNMDTLDRRTMAMAGAGFRARTFLAREDVRRHAGRVPRGSGIACGGARVSEVLIIRLGALGDFVQSFGPFAAIRAHHRDARITLLTTRPFAALAQAAPWFDEVWIDDKPRWWNLPAVSALRRRLRSRPFARVYDLQTSDRSSFYFRLLPPGTEWSGIARTCSHPHANPDRDRMHTLERQAEQLRMAGITDVPGPDLSWVPETALGRELARFALICPGGAAHRPAKRWPVEGFIQAGLWLEGQGLTPVLLGTPGETQPVKAGLACAVDLGGRTSLLDIAALGRRAAAAVGNDTGPMHLIASAGCPALVLFSGASDPALCAPRGRVEVLRRPHLGDLSASEVVAALDRMIQSG